MVWAAWFLGMALATKFLEQKLTNRAQRPSQWPTCPKCHHRLRSKGMRPLKIQTLVGIVHWQRRVGRCPQGCQGTQVAPEDVALGINPHQQTSMELVQLGCLLAVEVPFQTVTVLLQRLIGIQLNQQTIWSWVQSVGAQAIRQLQSSYETTDRRSGANPRNPKVSRKS